MITTGGGTFDRSEWPIYFAAGVAPDYPTHMLLAVNDLFGQSGEDTLQHWLNQNHRVLLDSGVFWLANEHARTTGCRLDEALSLPPQQLTNFTSLFDRYCYLTATYGHRLWGYIELDQGGQHNKTHTRARLHKGGLSPIPVYHPFNDDWDYFDQLATQYDRVCIGNLVQASQPVRLRLLHTLWERRRAYPHVWLHVLGLTASEVCHTVPPDSCDSSSWLNALRYPDVRTESAALRGLGPLGQRFQYVHGSNDGRGRDYAVTTYADTVTHTNATWALTSQRTSDLGAEPHPEYQPGERTPHPATHRKDNHAT